MKQEAILGAVYTILACSRDLEETALLHSLAEEERTDLARMVRSER